MVIANPIYDVVFKKLMENERVAKFFIGRSYKRLLRKGFCLFHDRSSHASDSNRVVNGQC